MNAHEYCTAVEAKDILHKKLEKDYLIIENGSPLVSLKDVDFHLIYEPSVMTDYQYLVREELVDKIRRISNQLNEEDKSLIIRSAWRSFKHQLLLWQSKIDQMTKKFPEKTLSEIQEITSYFIAPPKKSTHATGGALDALIMDNKTNQVLDFGTNKGFEISLGKECYPYYPLISEKAKANRKLLIDLFEEEDFVCDMKEYWHFDYGNIGWAIEKRKRHAIYGIIDNS